MRITIKVTLFLLLFAFCCYGCAQTSQPKEYADYSDRSGFMIKNVDSVKVDNLVVLGKVWGFAKYHHPVFANSIYNIDYELFELLPKVAYADKGECNAILFDWVNGLGSFKTAEAKWLKKIKDDDYILAADTDWIYDTALLGEELSGVLQDLRYAERAKPSRYARYVKYTGQADFSAESGKGSSFSSDVGYNLLILFRLWNMAEYYFPSVNITDKKWTDVLEEYVPKFLNTKSTNWTTAELIAELCDTHSMMFNNPVYSNDRLPVELKYVENKLIVSDNRKFLAKDEESVFEVGDEIISIDGHSSDYFIERASKYISASNENVLLRDAAGLAGYVSGKEAPVVVDREGRRLKFDIVTISRQEYYNKRNEWEKGKTYYELLNDSVGYLYPGKFKNTDGSAIMAKFAHAKAIIIDMRCYPSDFMPYMFIGQYFISEKTPFAKIIQPANNLPGQYQKLVIEFGYNNKNYYKGKVVVLVNDGTQSSAEYQTMAFQAAPNTIVVGSQTAGADGNIVVIPLLGNIKTLFSGLGVFYPDGTNTQRTGIRIDHYIEPTIEGIKQGQDEVLEKALEIIESGL